MPMGIGKRHKFIQTHFCYAIMSLRKCSIPGNGKISLRVILCRRKRTTAVPSAFELSICRCRCRVRSREEFDFGCCPLLWCVVCASMVPNRPGRLMSRNFTFGPKNLRAETLKCILRHPGGPQIQRRRPFSLSANGKTGRSLARHPLPPPQTNDRDGTSCNGIWLSAFESSICRRRAAVTSRCVRRAIKRGERERESGLTRVSRQRRTIDRT